MLGGPPFSAQQLIKSLSDLCLLSACSAPSRSALSVFSDRQALGHCSAEECPYDLQDNGNLCSLFFQLGKEPGALATLMPRPLT
jgi:hypothetical protein